jgi:hypothetical protein
VRVVAQTVVQLVSNTAVAIYAKLRHAVVLPVEATLLLTGIADLLFKHNFVTVTVGDYIQLLLPQLVDRLLALTDVTLADAPTGPMLHSLAAADMAHMWCLVVAVAVCLVQAV